MAILATPPAIVAPDPAPGVRRAVRVVGRGYVCVIVVRGGVLKRVVGYRIRF